MSAYSDVQGTFQKEKNRISERNDMTKISLLPQKDDIL